MKTVEEYRQGCRVLLGDQQGRRYSDEVLDMGLREALETYGRYCPRKETIRAVVRAVENGLAVLNCPMETGMTLLAVRREKNGDYPDFSVYSLNGKLCLKFYSTAGAAAAGEHLELTVEAPHLIRDLDGANLTTVPETGSLTLVKGAAAAAEKIRARSVTEVFGKRPEDGQNLTAQAEALYSEFLRELQERALMESYQQDPWPKRGFWK